MYKVMIVEDDQVISRQLEKNLKSWGYETCRVEDFNTVTAFFAQEQPQLVLMDIGLPFFNGYYWCQEIRKLSKVPILFLSSASDKMNIVMAMNMGGDDFMVKPFDMEVLVAKIGAMLRRSYDFQSQTELLTYKGVILNMLEACLVIQGKKVALTKNEFRIMEVLFTNKGKVVSRETLMKKLWDSECFIDDNTLTVNVTRLRKKLEEMNLADFILTKKGIGYYLEAE